MLDSIIRLLQIYEAGIKGPLGDAGCIYEVAQGKEVMDRGLARSEARLRWAAQLVLLRPTDKPSIQDDCVQPVQRLAHSNGPIVGCIKGTTLLVDWGDQG
jgi:hypothetical protein